MNPQILFLKYHAMKTVSCSGCFTPWEQDPGTLWIWI